MEEARSTRSSSGSEPNERKQAQYNGTPVLAASAVLVLSLLAWQLVGAEVVVHFSVLVVGIFLGALIQQRPTPGAPADGPPEAAAATAVAVVGGTDAAAATARGGASANGNGDGRASAAALAASGQQSRPSTKNNTSSSNSSSIVPSFLSNVVTGGDGSSSGGATASSLLWVGETVEGSISWLRGCNRCKTAPSSDQINGIGSAGGSRSSRRRSMSTEGCLLLSPDTAAATSNSLPASAATSPVRRAGPLRRDSPAATVAAAAAAARATQPTVSASTPTPQQAQQPARSRVWSRTFGGGGRQQAGEGLAVDAYDGDGSIDDDDDLDGGTDGDDSEVLRRAAATAAAEDWLVGTGPGDTSESGSLSSWRGGGAARARRSTAGGSDTGGEGPGELRWQVDGRRQSLRRSLTSAGVPTEESQMVQDLLEMVSDAPVDHAGQWIPVRVRRGIHIWTSTVEGSPYCRIRGRMRCEATPAQLLQLLIDDERIGEYDRMFDRYELVERPNDHTSVRWTSYRAIWPTRPRDFVIRSTWEEFADGTIVIATRSVEHEDYPETPTFVRGKMVTCGYVICPLGESRRRRHSGSKSAKSTAAPQPTPVGATGLSSATAAAAAAAGAGGSRSMELRPSSEFTMYAHTDLGGVLPASVINKLCKKPAYRVLRKIQDMVATDNLVKRGDDGSSTGGGGVWPLGGARPASTMSRIDSEDVLGSLLAEGMPDRAAAANLENVPEGEVEGASGAETDPTGQRRGSDSGGPARRGSMSQQGQLPTPSRAPSPLLPGLSRAYAIHEAQRIMKTLNKMASDESLGWSQLGVAAHSDMALYKSPVPGTKKVRLGASTCVSALPSELVGILLENAAMLGPDYIVDRQELLETFSSGVNTGEGSAEAAARAEGEEPQHDTAIYWFSCTHKRQRICRDFVILRCFRPLPGCGGLIAYSSVEHPGLPPCPDYVRGKLDVSGFVILPSPKEAEEEPSPHSDVGHNRRGGPRRNKMRRQRVRGGSSSGSNVSAAHTATGSGGGGTVTRRRSRSFASGIGKYLDSDDDDDDDVEEGGGGATGHGKDGGGARSRRTQRSGITVGGVGGGGGGGVSEVTFFTHLTFSAFLPDFQEMEACRHFVGPLHILQELKWVVERTLGSFQEDEVLQEAAAEVRAGGAGGGGGDWGRVLSRRRSSRSERRSSGMGGEMDTSAGEAEAEGGVADSSASVSDSESVPPRESVTMSNAVLLRVSARREAALRDMLAFSSDGECMDGPQVDWRIIKDSDGLKLWRATVPGTVWCMIRTRTAVAVPPREVLTYLLNDSCIPDYDELFAKIEVVETVDDSSVFKRTSYKPIWPTAPRDFSLLSSWGTLEDGTCYLVNRSVDHPMNPPVKGHVRGVVMLCGFLMVPRSQEAGGGCVITMIVHTDLGGNLPATIINRLSTSSPWRLVQRLRGAFESNGRQPSPAQRAAAKAAAAATAAAAAAAEGEGPVVAGTGDIVAGNSV